MTQVQKSSKSGDILMPLLEAFKTDNKNVISMITEAISNPTKYIAFKTTYTDTDIKRTIMAICDELKKDKETKLMDANTLKQAQQIMRYFADIIKQKNEAKSLLNGKDKFSGYLSSKTTIEICDEAKKDETKGKAARKRNADEGNCNLEVDSINLTEIIDQDNINPTKRKRLISKQYQQDDEQIPKGWHPIQQETTKPFIIISSINNGQESDEEISTIEMKDKIESVLDEEQEEYGEIEQITKNSKVVTIYFEDIYNRDKFIKYVKCHQASWSWEIPKLRNPCVRVNGVIIRGNEEGKKVDWDRWVDKIRIKNKWIPNTQDSIFKVVFSVEKKGKWNIVLEVSPNIRQAIIKKKGKIYSGIQKYEVYDNFNILACYNCSSYGHTTNQCGQQPTCNFCSKQHYNKCPVKEIKEKQKCPSCKKLGHSFNEVICSEFMWRLKYELQFINMNYDLIMAPQAK